MAALAIVEHLNVFEDGGFGLCPRSKTALMDHLLLQRCEKLSIGALSKHSPLRLMDCVSSAFLISLRYSLPAYWADSTGRRNTFDYILFEQLVESFDGSSPTEGFAGPCVQGMRDRAQCIGTVLAEICALGKVLT